MKGWCQSWCQQLFCFLQMTINPRHVSLPEVFLEQQNWREQAKPGSHRLSHLTGKPRKQFLNYQCSVTHWRLLYHSKLRRHSRRICFVYAGKVEANRFDTLASAQSLAILHILHINSVSDRTLGLRLKFETWSQRQTKWPTVAVWRLDNNNNNNNNNKQICIAP